MADVDIEELVASAPHATDHRLVRRGTAPGPFTLEAVADTIDDEVTAARRTRAALDDRITAIAQFAAPTFGRRIVGQYYDNSMDAAGGTTLAGAANRVEMTPFIVAEPLRIDQMGIAISTAVASAALKCFIYSANANGMPDQLLYEGPANLDGGSTGYKSHALDFTFEAGRLYWIGVKMSSTATYRAIPLSGAMNLGLSGSNATSYFTVIRRTLTYANALPASWNFVTGDLVAAITPPSIRMRAAA